MNNTKKAKKLLVIDDDEIFHFSVRRLNKRTDAVKISQDGDMKAIIVKTSSDQFSGRLSYLKVLSGSLTADTEVFNISAEGRKEKVGKLFRCTGKKLEVQMP